MTGSVNSDPGDYTHVVAAIIWQSEKRDSLLISKRQKGKHLENHWELPGGKIESGESCQHALYRELREEIDIIPVKARWFERVYHEYPNRNILLEVWEVTRFKGDVVAREGQELMWVAVDQLAEFKFPAADIPILQAIKNNVTVEKEHLRGPG